MTKQSRSRTDRYVLLLPAQRIYIAQIMGIIAIFTGVASFVLPSSTFIGRPTSKGHVTPYHNFGSRNGCSIRLLALRKNIYTSRNETQVNTDNTSSYATSAKETGFSSVAAQEVEETLTASSPVSQMNHAAHQEHNGQYLGNKMDFIQCECQDDTFDGSRQKYDDLLNELFVSLVEKIRAYNPEAVEGIDLSRLDEDDGDSLTLDGIMPVNGSKTDESPGLLLLRAYQYAMAAHAGQCRKSGEPYITHPLGVAHIIADLKLDTPSLLTALLHDTVEDTSVTLQNITDLFSSEIAHLVDGVTKVGKLPFTSYEERQSENYRKMILAMSQDIRVVLVKLADRAHNMRTLQYMPAEKQKRIATETHEIYVPLAHRLGIHWLKTELEDECFQYLHPEQFESLKGQVSEKAGERKEYEMEVVQVLEHQMKEAGLGIDGKTLLVSGRTKGLYSIYTKMERQNIALDDVYDKIGFRIIVDDVASCYQALGIIHSHWKPAGTGKIKDYIALPKPNGYKSLHTTIIGPRGKRIEVQIRTSEMHEVAESGIAAHWTYKQKANRGNRSTKEDPSQFTWLRELMAEVQRQHDPIEFIDSVKEDLYAKEVFVFSPKGDLYALSRGSSVLDFAYLVHSDLGNHCAGAKVNGKMVTLKAQVQNGDTIEILKSNHQTPKREWLRYVRTSKAKNKIRAWLKRRQREKSVFEGKAMLEQGLKKSGGSIAEAKKEYHRKLDHLLATFRLQDERELFSALGYGRLTIEAVVKELFEASAVQTHGSSLIDKRAKDDGFVLQAIENQNILPATSSSRFSKNGIVVGKERNILLSFCRNCRPLYGEHILGVITKGNGIKVHRQGCEHLLEADEQRIVSVKWDSDSANLALRPIDLYVLCEDVPGVLASMCHAISSVGFNIGNVNLRKLSSGRGLARVEVMLRTADDMERVISKIKQEDGIISVSRR